MRLSIYWIESMRALFLPFIFVALALHAIAANPIPPELVGVWKNPQDERQLIFLWEDGMALVFDGPIIVPGNARYDGKGFNILVTPNRALLGLQDSKIEDIPFRYDPKSKVIEGKDYKKGGVVLFKRLDEKTSREFMAGARTQFSN